MYVGFWWKQRGVTVFKPAAPPRFQALARAAQKRHCARYRRLSNAGKAHCQVTTAVVRELETRPSTTITYRSSSLTSANCSPHAQQYRRSPPQRPPERHPGTVPGDAPAAQPTRRHLPSDAMRQPPPGRPRRQAELHRIERGRGRGRTIPLPPAPPLSAHRTRSRPTRPRAGRHVERYLLSRLGEAAVAFRKRAEHERNQIGKGLGLSAGYPIDRGVVAQRLVEPGRIWFL